MFRYFIADLLNSAELLLYLANYLANAQTEDRYLSELECDLFITGLRMAGIGRRLDETKLRVFLSGSGPRG